MYVKMFSDCDENKKPPSKMKRAVLVGYIFKAF
jgi:hypothetical protein